MRRLRNTVACMAMSATALVLSSCGQGSSSGNPGIEGVNRYDFSFGGGQARLSIVFASLHLDAGATIPLSKPAGSTIQLGPDFSSGGTLFVISVPLAGLINNDTTGMPLLGLPDGRAIPDVVRGAITGSVVDLPLFGISFLYTGKDVFGLFLPIDLPKTTVGVRVRMRDELGNILGYIYGIPKANAKQVSGVLVLVPIDGGSAMRPKVLI